MSEWVEGEAWQDSAVCVGACRRGSGKGAATGGVDTLGTASYQLHADISAAVVCRLFSSSNPTAPLGQDAATGASQSQMAAAASITCKMLVSTPVYPQ